MLVDSNAIRVGATYLVKYDGQWQHAQLVSLVQEDFSKGTYIVQLASDEQVYVDHLHYVAKVEL